VAVTGRRLDDQLLKGQKVNDEFNGTKLKKVRKSPALGGDKLGGEGHHLERSEGQPGKPGEKRRGNWGKGGEVTP